MRLWHETWLRRLAEKYEAPITALERLAPDDLAYEIALLLADAVVRAAAALPKATSRERLNTRTSGDWFDRLTWERYELDKQRAKEEER